jgi:hypothetical protein
MFAHRAVMRPLLPLILLVAPCAVAQAEPDEQQDPPPIAAPRPNPDFLFGRPDGFLGIRAGWVMNRAGSDWYDFVTDQLTIDSGAFNAPSFGLDVAIPVARRVDALVTFDFSQATIDSEYRRFVDNNRLPINQQTRLRGANIAGNVKVSLTERGRDVGRLAWVPNAVVPYVGAGGGVSWYQLRQVGDFVDFVDLSVFPDVFESSGWTPSAQAFGGVEIRLHRRLFLTVDARYLWAEGTLGSQWIDFDPLDLAGMRLSTGISVAF